MNPQPNKPTITKIRAIVMAGATTRRRPSLSNRTFLRESEGRAHFYRCAVKIVDTTFFLKPLAGNATPTFCKRTLSSRVQK
jgi:hypothetical protein